MQTFVPATDIHECARVLDDQRLAKQIIECRQILRAARYQTKGWVNHPAVRMWRGYELALVRYAQACHAEYLRRRNKPHQAFLNMVDIDLTIDDLQRLGTCDPPMPPWWGCTIHATHRSNLLRKNPDWYGQFGWTEGDDLDYHWPVTV